MLSRPGLKSGGSLTRSPGSALKYPVRTPFFPVSYRHLLVPLLLLLLVTGLKGLFDREPAPMQPEVPPVVIEAENLKVDRSASGGEQSHDDLAINDAERMRKEGGTPPAVVPASQKKAEQRGN
jgi:hypothetical protein